MISISNFLRRLSGKASGPTKVPQGGYLLQGPVGTAAEAASLCTGYDSLAILTAVETAMAAVRRGEAAMERDGVAIKNMDYPLALISACLRQAIKEEGSLRVLDFGGSLGSSFRACQPWLTDLEEVAWGVVEQPLFVNRGRERHSTENLRFFDSIAECVSSIKPNLILISGVLMYVDQPWSILEELGDSGANTLVIDRTLLTRGSDPLIYVEHVHMPAYSASYPCHCLPQPTLVAALTQRFNILQEFQPLDIVPAGLKHLKFWGAILEKKS